MMVSEFSVESFVFFLIGIEVVDYSFYIILFITDSKDTEEIGS